MFHKALQLAVLVCVCMTSVSAVCAENGGDSSASAAKPDTKARSGKTVRVAGIVLKWVRAKPELNYKRIEPLIREAASNGAKIVVTTECFLDGYAVRDKSIPVEKFRALGERIPDGKYFQKFTSQRRVGPR